jgi:recombination protein RecA
VGQGRENAKQYLKEHPEITNEIDASLRELYGIGAEKPAVESKED